MINTENADALNEKKICLRVRYIEFGQVNVLFGGRGGVCYRSRYAQSVKPCQYCFGCSLSSTNKKKKINYKSKLRKIIEDRKRNTYGCEQF